MNTALPPALATPCWRGCLRLAAGTVAAFGLLWLATNVATAQDAAIHYLHPASAPPGAIGAIQLQRGGPLGHYPQPVEIRGPEGLRVSFADEGAFSDPEPTPAKAGLLVGRVYRLRLTDLPEGEGEEVFPTLEIIDRTYPPVGQAWRFPAPIVIADQDLQAVRDGRFVTRVIYLEDSDRAMPAATTRDEDLWIDAARGANPLEMADQMGRPIAILRLGGRLPDDRTGADDQFLFGSPPVQRFVAPPPSEPDAMLSDDGRTARR
jgi:hypothetical protein